MEQTDHISTESGSFAVVSMHYNKEWKNYCKATNTEAFSALAQTHWSKELISKHSLLWLLGQFFKKARIQSQTEQQKGENTPSSQQKSTEIIFHKLLCEVGVLLRKCWFP